MQQQIHQQDVFDFMNRRTAEKDKYLKVYAKTKRETACVEGDEYEIINFSPMFYKVTLGDWEKFYLSSDED